MSNLGTNTQSPTERKSYLLDYSSWLQAGEIITTVSAVTSPTTPTPIASADSLAIVNSGTAVSAYVSGGVSGTIYRIFVTINTNLGQVKEDEFRINCVDPALQ